MNDYDNTIRLYAENGEEVEFEIVHHVSYGGEMYYVLWSEETDDTIAVVQRNGEYETVDDDDILDYIQTSYIEGFADLKMELDSLSDETENLQDSIASMLSEIEEFKSKSPSDEPIKEVSNNNSVIDDDMDAFTVMFDEKKYIIQSQDYLFKNAQQKYSASNFKDALQDYIEADNEGNAFAAAHIGMMYHYGEGCIQSDEKAYYYFDKGAKNGCPLAYAWKAECYRMGLSVEKDKELSNKMYRTVENALRKMCKAEDVSALYFLGFNLIMGVGCKTNEVEGVNMIETAVYRGDIRSAILLAECYLKGWGVSKDEKMALELLQKYPAEGHRKYHYLLGYIYYLGLAVEKNYNKAFCEFEKSANLGYGMAKDYLGDCYAEGRGVEKNQYEAAKWYKEAADQHKIYSAAYSLAFMYSFGEGVMENKKKAFEYFLIAAEGDILPAQKLVSEEYIAGKVVEQDFEKGRFWMEKAAEAGDPEAQLTLGRYYISDFGFNDDQKAFEWFLKAGEQGYTEAEYIVGGCYLNEIYVTQDFENANQWFKKAAAKGHPKALFELGISYIEGRGVSKNINTGIDYMKEGAEQNSPECCKYLAKQYKHGIKNYGGQSNYTNLEEAYTYAKKLLELSNDADSQCLLASVLQEFGKNDDAESLYREAVEKSNSELAMIELSKIYILKQANYYEAVSMLEKISSNNNGEAQYLLAYCLENGYGCPKDKKRAKLLYSSAHANGYHGNPVPRKKKFGLF